MTLSISSFSLRVNIFRNNRVVKKVLRFLPGRFGLRVTAIEEGKNLDYIKDEELVRSL